MSKYAKRELHARVHPRPQQIWGLYNMGHLWSVHHTKRDAIKECEHNCMEPWEKARQYMEIHKVVVALPEPPEDTDKESAQ